MGSLHADSNDSPSVYRQGAERRSPARWFVLGFCLALCGIALSLWLSRLWSEREQEFAQAQFNRDAKARIEALQQILAARLATVSTTAAFFRGSEGYDRKRFATLAKQILEKQPGIQLLAWAPRIPGNKRPAHEQALRTEGFPKYAIGQHGGPGRMTVASERDDYYPVLFFEPAHDNQVLLGYDLGSEPAFRAAFHEGVAGRPTVVNSSLGYGREGDQSLLCVIELARRESPAPAAGLADQAETDGFVVGLFRVGQLVEEALDLFAPVGIDVYLTKSAEKGKSTPVYTRLSASHGTTAGQTGENLRLAREIEVGDALWIVTCVPTASYLAQFQSWGPMGVLLAGLCITGLLLGYLPLLAGRAAAPMEQPIAKRWKELSDSELRFRRLVDNAGDAFFLRTEEGKIVDVNRRACDSLGYTREELLSMTIMDVDETFGSKNLAQYSKRPAAEYPLTFEGAHRRKDGTTFPVEIRLAPLDVNGQRLMLALVRDITDRKQAELALQEEQHLLRDMLELHERERKLVAYEIHDGLAQQLTAALYKFQAVEVSRDSDPAAARGIFDDGLRMLRQAMAETRRLIGGLRPPMLDEAGVVAALDYLIAGVAQDDGPEIEFVREGDLDGLAPPLKSAVFRIVQECLNNARHHSRSKKIRVELRSQGGRLVIKVQDWGTGFDPAAVEGEHFGLRGINERARLLGGRATIQTAVQQGTCITVELPLLSPAETETAQSSPRAAGS